MILALSISLGVAVVVAFVAARGLVEARRALDTRVDEGRQGHATSEWSALRLRPKRIREDIERLKQSELDSQTRYKILTDNVAAAVFLHQPDGKILWCSPYTEVLTGFSLSEVYSNADTFMTAHVHDDDREMIKSALGIVGQGEPFQCRYRFYHNSGIMLWFETRTVPVFDHVASEYVALSITLDVTASVMSQLKTEERNRDLNEFTYMLSHDLKAPIVTLRGMLSVLQEELGKAATENVTQPLSYMEKAIYRLERLVEGVLELARVSTAEKALEPIDLNEAVREVIEDYKLEIERSNATVTAVSELPWVLGDKTHLYQIFSNLIGNALKYGASNRQLMVSIGGRGASSRHRVSIDIRDNGRGIPPEFSEMIFKPFNRAGEEAIQGSGVGLACVKRMVEKLGGGISVQSEVGQGSTFTIELRRAPEGARHS